LAEIDKMVVELVEGEIWPSWLNNKPALMRAYKKTTLRDGNGDDWVQKHEFHALLLNIFWFNKLYAVFRGSVDPHHERRLDCGEFGQMMSTFGVQFGPGEAQQEFNKADTNHGGPILFVEFCAYVRNRISPDHNEAFDADIYSGEHCGKSMRKRHGHRATHTHFLTKKCMGDFDELEKKIKALMRDHGHLLKIWHQIDFNGNNIVSLAEIDKFVVEAYPLLNHKPALMRAYKRTIHDGNGDDWVQRREFKSLLANIFYFNKLFWLFEKEDGDHDRRMTYQEYKHLMSATGCKVSEAEAQREFHMIDKNHGGIVLFDEFCKYFTMKACPESLHAFVE